MAQTAEYTKIDLRVGTQAQFNAKVDSLPAGTLFGITDATASKADLDTGLKNEINGKLNKPTSNPTSDSAVVIDSSGKTSTKALSNFTEVYIGDNAPEDSDTSKIWIVPSADPQEPVIEYGIRWANTQSDPKGERVIRTNGIMSTWDIKFTPNVGTVNYNPFDSIKLFNPDIVYDTFGNKFSRFERFYWAREVVGDYTYTWVCKTKANTNYHLPKAFSDGGTDWDYVDIGCYEAATETTSGINYLVSKPNKILTNYLTRTENYKRAKNYNTRLGNPENQYYMITTMSEYCEILTPLILIMYGTRNTQSIYNGVASMDMAEKTVLAYDKTIKTMYFGTDISTTYKVGYTLALNNVKNADGTNYRTITENGAITGTITNGVFTYSASGTNYYYVKVDGDLIDNLTKVIIHCCPTGLTDSINATSGTISNSGHYSFKAFNIENIYGNTWNHILDVTVKDTIPYICKDIKTWTDTGTPETSSNFEKVNYTVGTTAGYAKTMGYDEIHPDVQMTTEIGASSTTYYSDLYYQSVDTRTVLVGGALDYQSGAGLFCWAVLWGLGVVGWRIASRLSRRCLSGGS